MKAYGGLSRSARSVTHRVSSRRQIVVQCLRLTSSWHGSDLPGVRRGYADHVENKILRDLAAERRPLDFRFQPEEEEEDRARPTATLLVNDIKKLNPDQLLSQFPRIQLLRKNRDLKTVVFLVTPGLAHLFEPDHEFHAAALKRICEPETQDALHTTLVAVVDAVPLYNMPWHRPLPAKPSEGVSILVCPTVKTSAESLPDDRPALFEIHTTERDMDDELLPVTSISAPVANTLFVNGRRNTLFTQRWHWDLMRERWEHSANHPRVDLSRASVRAYTSYNPSAIKSQSLGLYSYLKPLTRSGIVAKSMGNVVRQITLSDGSTKPASHELELLVPGILKHARELDSSTDIAIFALVYPTSLRGETDGIFEMAKLDPTWFLRLLVRGARLHRVTSGGGGWGSKAGLLAFEPATDFQHDIDEISSMFPGFAIEEDGLQMPATRDVIPEGHVVQFFRLLIHSPKRQARERIFISDGPQQPNSWFQPESTHIYSIGSTTLDAEGGFGTRHGDAASAEDGVTSSDEAELDNIVTVPSRFGFLTTSPLCLSVDRSQLVAGEGDIGEASSHNTLIEAANTCVTFTFASGGRNSKRENKSFGSASKHGVLYTRLAGELRRQMRQQDEWTTQWFQGDEQRNYFEPLDQSVPVRTYNKAVSQKFRFVISKKTLEDVLQTASSKDPKRAEKLEQLIRSTTRTRQERKILKNLVLNLFEKVLEGDRTVLDEEERRSLQEGADRTRKLLADL